LLRKSVALSPEVLLEVNTGIDFHLEEKPLQSASGANSAPCYYPASSQKPCLLSIGPKSRLQVSCKSAYSTVVINLCRDVVRSCQLHWTNQHHLRLSSKSTYANAVSQQYLSRQICKYLGMIISADHLAGHGGLPEAAGPDLRRALT
jgi:hypothetical protein